MQFMKTLAISVCLLGVSNADSKCTSGNAVSIEGIMASTGIGEGSDSLNLAGIAQGLINAGLSQKVKRKDESLKCTNSEICYSIRAVPFCYNSVTAGFRAIGLTGNALTGDYMTSDGQRGNLYTGPHPTHGSSLASSGGISSGTTRRRSSTLRSIPTATHCLDKHGGQCDGEDDFSTSTVFGTQTSAPAATTVNGIFTTTVLVGGAFSTTGGSLPTATSINNEAGFRATPKARGVLAVLVGILLF